MLLEVRNIQLTYHKVVCYFNFHWRFHSIKDLLKVVTDMEEKSDIKNPGNDNSESKKRKIDDVDTNS